MKSAPQRRAYSSPARQRQAQATRRRIADAAEELLCKNGFAGMSISAVAKKAEVAPQTVYAVFGSKRGILEELIARITSKIVTSDIIGQVQAASAPLDILRLAVGITRRVHEASNTTFAAVRGAAVVSPDLADLEKKVEEIRYQKQAHLFQKLKTHAGLRSDISETILQDIVWSLTGREFYRLLVIERGWPPERYENWLTDLIAHSIFPGAGTASDD